jgi:PAS domain S-box-containing protein
LFGRQSTDGTSDFTGQLISDENHNPCKEKPLNDLEKTKEQLIDELKYLRERCSEGKHFISPASQTDLLRESEARYRAVIETISEPYAEHDLAGNITYFNDAYVDEMGYSRQELQGLSYRNYVDKNDLDPIYRLYNEVYKTGIPAKSSELESVNKDGKKNQYEVTVSLIRDSEEKPVGFRTLFHNITERRNAEDAIRSIQERLELVLAGAELGLYDINSQTGASYVDDRYLDMLGYKREDFLAFNIEVWLQLIHPEDLNSIKERVREVMSGDRRLVEMEYRLRHKSGDWVWVLGRGRVVSWDEAGKPLRFTGTQLNITDRKKVQEALRLSEERLRLVTDNMKDIIVMTDQNFNILYISPSVFSVMGYNSKDREGKSILDYIHPDDLPAIEQGLKDSLATFSPGKMECRYMHARGEYIWLEAKGAYMLDQQNNFLGSVLGIRDITERKKAEEALQKTLDELEIRVKERTFELQEINTTLRVLLKNRDDDQKNLQESLQSNIHQLVIPFIQKLRSTHTSEQKLEYLNILETNLNNIASPFINKLSMAYKNLSPRELQVAALIKQGKSSKEISDIFNLSVGTVNSYRNSIREKLNLISSDTNLRTYLLALT